MVVMTAKVGGLAYLGSLDSRRRRARYIYIYIYILTLSISVAYQSAGCDCSILRSDAQETGSDNSHNFILLAT